eukprot:2271820-Amphidinium_carterae.2
MTLAFETLPQRSDSTALVFPTNDLESPLSAHSLTWQRVNTGYIRDERVSQGPRFSEDVEVLHK